MRGTFCSRRSRRAWRTAKSRWFRLYPRDRGKLDCFTPSVPHGLDPQFAFYFLVQRAFREEALKHVGQCRSAPGTQDYLRDYPVPVPQSEEQLRIVRLIGALFEEIDAGEQAL